MSRRLATSVTITDGNGLVKTYGANSVPPEEVAALITNPDCWVEDEGPVPVSVPVVGLPPEAPRESVSVVPPATTPQLLTSTEQAPAEGDQPPAGHGEQGGDPDDDEHGDFTPPADGADVPQPPRNGPTAAWRARALFLGQEVPEGAGREAIVDLLETAGLLEK